VKSEEPTDCNPWALQEKNIMDHQDTGTKQDLSMINLASLWRYMAWEATRVLGWTRPVDLAGYDALQYIKATSLHQEYDQETNDTTFAFKIREEGWILNSRSGGMIWHEALYQIKSIQPNAFVRLYKSVFQCVEATLIRAYGLLVREVDRQRIAGLANLTE
jgi:hypothetical protein